jgi:hypothetical protein
MTWEPGVFVPVGPAVRPKLVSGDEGVRLLCIGGTPGGRSYQPPEWNDESAVLSLIAGKREAGSSETLAPLWQSGP